MKTKARLIMALKIWIVIYPSITLFLFLLGKPLSLLPLYQRTFLLTIILVPWIVFVGVPLLEILLNSVFPKKEFKKTSTK
jgi:antibiotic biosynthesis monooxygenase (ABM) superfamily enzyme